MKVFFTLSGGKVWSTSTGSDDVENDAVRPAEPREMGDGTVSIVALELLRDMTGAFRAISAAVKVIAMAGWSRECCLPLVAQPIYACRRGPTWA
mmetsp:Transcript_29688/g.75582  ORF Transcript_29688/g.75582 Transcript_29688/m.75582 type:complete len:94 (-) Transcript_29688:2-283(-)